MLIERKWKKWLYFYLPMAAFIVFTLFPFYWMAITAFRPDAELYATWRQPNAAPLWTLLLAGAFSLAGSAPAWAKALGMTAALATALLTRRLVWMWTESRALALAGGVIAAVAGPLVWGALSGMEVSLAALLVTGAIVLHTAGRDAPTALLLGLALYLVFGRGVRPFGVPHSRR